jgi:transcriptional regulator with XRE-family HTH domain
VPGETLKKQLATYLRNERGDMTFAQFARKTGISNSSLQRLERGEQNLTLASLETLLQKLKVRIRDVFPD